jgi:hypothetical protein
MALSNRFKELRRRLNELRAHLLPAKFSPTGDYTDRQQDRARGYRLLAHAEIESYFEDISRETVTNAIIEWKRNTKATNTIVAFLASYHSSWSVSDDIKNDEVIKIAKSRVNKDSVAEIINLAQTQFTQRLKENNGIKEKDFKTLMIPTGIDVSSLDQTWLTNINSFGTKRGEVAHHSKGTQGSLNPRDEFDTVKALLLGIEKLDRLLMQLRI